jgi:hypothetical protein
VSHPPSHRCTVAPRPCSLFLVPFFRQTHLDWSTMSGGMFWIANPPHQEQRRSSGTRTFEPNAVSGNRPRLKRSRRPQVQKSRRRSRPLQTPLLPSGQPSQSPSLRTISQFPRSRFQTPRGLTPPVAALMTGLSQQKIGTVCHARRGHQSRSRVRLLRTRERHPLQGPALQTPARKLQRLAHGTLSR